VRPQAPTSDEPVTGIAESRPRRPGLSPHSPPRCSQYWPVGSLRTRPAFRGSRRGGRSREARSVQGQVEKLEFDNKRLHAKVGELEMARRLDRDGVRQVEATLGDLQSSSRARATTWRSIAASSPRSTASRACASSASRFYRAMNRARCGSNSRSCRRCGTKALSRASRRSLWSASRRCAGALSVGDLLGKPRAELPFSFRYFQTIEQAVVLPEGFEPFEADVRCIRASCAHRCSRHLRGKSPASRSPRYEAGVGKLKSAPRFDRPRRRPEHP